MKITPGPWIAEENVKAGGIVHYAITSRANWDEWMVCSITPMHLKRQQDVDNAQAIAALPDCLEALKAMLYCGTGGAQAVEARKLAEAALKKAGVV